MKLTKMAIVTLAFSMVMSTTALAGTWSQGKNENQNKWWYDNGDSTYATNGWQWIDGNNDGTAECYYFDASGWLLNNTTTPDGYQVNENGAWVKNGKVETKQVSITNQQISDISGNYTYYAYMESGKLSIATTDALNGDILMKHVNIVVLDENTISVNIDGADIVANNIIMKKQGDAYITYSFEKYQPLPEETPSLWIDQEEVELHLYELIFDSNNQISVKGKHMDQLDEWSSIYRK